GRIEIRSRITIKKGSEAKMVRAEFNGSGAEEKDARPRADHNGVKNKLYVLFSVDWEPDHGKWRAAGAEHDYGGILVGTPALEQLLDELNLPCTWFIEASQDPRRDLPSLFPPIVKRLAAR